jgi:diguanylate cyclase (GGDEF)-like protein/PAS domain S-box-containing protein
MHLSARQLKKDEFAREWSDADSEAIIHALARRPHPWHSQLMEVVEATPDFVAIMDSDGWLHYLNRAGRAMLGLTDSEDICGLHIEDCHPEGESHRLLNEAFPAAHRDGVWKGESEMKAADGRKFSVSQVVLAHGRQNGRDLMFSTIARDITERKHFADELKRQATHDALTGLPNRVVLAEQLDMEIARAQRSRMHAAVILLDLDNSKRIKDSPAGDELLRGVALRLKSCLRSNDFIVRYGDDEFIIVAGELHSAENLLPLMHKLRAALEQPVQVGSQELIVGFSAGASIFPNDGNSAPELLQNADAALKRAKSSGGNQCQFYELEMNARSQELLALETDLRRAIEREEFVLHYQPQFHLCAGRVAGFEALLRWRHPTRGLISPADFVPMLEETGLIVPVGEWALRRVCEESRKLRDQTGAPVPVSVNVSARQFGDHRLVDELRYILRDQAMPPEDLELEITESTLMQDVQTVGEILAALGGLGVRLAIDDFGTGYSSLAQLKRFPLNALKIDRVFIDDLPWEDNCATIAEACISLGHKLGLEVIAEGVETAKQTQFLRMHGCDMIQGHYIGRPMPLDDAVRFAMGHNSHEVPAA